MSCREREKESERERRWSERASERARERDRAPAGGPLLRRARPPAARRGRQVRGGHVIRSRGGSRARSGHAAGHAAGRLPAPVHVFLTRQGHDVSIIFCENAALSRWAHETTKRVVRHGRVPWSRAKALFALRSRTNRSSPLFVVKPAFDRSNRLSARRRAGSAGAVCFTGQTFPCSPIPLLPVKSGVADQTCFAAKPALTGPLCCYCVMTDRVQGSRPCWAGPGGQSRIGLSRT